MSKFTFENTQKKDLRDCDPSDQGLVIQAVKGGFLEWANWDYNRDNFIKWMKHDQAEISPGAVYRVLAKPYTLEDALNEMRAKCEFESKPEGHLKQRLISETDAYEIIHKLGISLGDKS